MLRAGAGSIKPCRFSAGAGPDLIHVNNMDILPGLGGREPQAPRGGAM